MKKIQESMEFGGKTLTLATGHVAGQADGAVMATYGETVVLASVVSAPLKMDLDYFPLSVEYQEKLYAGGRIKGSRWVKREGRPTDDEILVARLIDRSVRPLFPKEYKKDVQIIVTVLSIDLENSPDMIGGIAASAALAISRIPWQGPISVMRVGMNEGVFITNPTESQLTESDLDIIVSSTKDAIVMIESGAKQVGEEVILKSVEYAQKEGEKLINLINSLAKKCGVEKESVSEEKISSDLIKKVKDESKEKVADLIKKMASKEASYTDFDEVKRAVSDLFEKDDDKKKSVKVFEDFFKQEMRKIILSGKRPDGRKLDEIRKLSAEISVLPRTHGSALFSRGQTQALSIATLGAPSLEQSIETASGEETKRYIHLYSMPPYSTGETGKVGSPNRREIGHGALAERALLPVIPKEDEFPYTIQVVTEILSSNGSTSMASVCGSTLSLMDSGVPIKAPIAGIAMGLVVEDSKKFSILTDIVGLEDGNGDMDFKVAGSKDGVTALQLDVKTLKLTTLLLEKALVQAKKARLEILQVMLKAIAAPRTSVSKFAPKIKIIHIDPTKIGELIGPGGKTIKRIIAETGSQIDVDDDGTVFVSATSEEDLSKGLSQVEGITKEPLAGEIYEGTVKRIQPFGAFIEILPGKEGLVHISDMSMDFVKDPSDKVSMGDKVKVRVKEIDELGRLNLSMLLEGDRPKSNNNNNTKDFNKSFNKDWNRGGERGKSFGRRFDRNRGSERDFSRQKGPHFPTSRLLEENKKSFGR